MLRSLKSLERYTMSSSGIGGMGPNPGLLADDGADGSALLPPKVAGDVHLRSAKEVRGYHIQGTDETIGHVEDFIVYWDRDGRPIGTPRSVL